jgi:hypothetical protein
MEALRESISRPETELKQERTEKTEMEKTCALLKSVLQIFENTSILEQETSLESKQNKIDYNLLDGYFLHNIFKCSSFFLFN